MTERRIGDRVTHRRGSVGGRVSQRRNVPALRVAHALVSAAVRADAVVNLVAINPFTPIKKAAAWIRTGYPQSAPRHGHIALIALLGKDKIVLVGKDD